MATRTGKSKTKSAPAAVTPQAPTPEAPTPAAPTPGPLIIVGLGASAGGLEALEAFFRHVAPDSGKAFVVVTHLDPGHASLLTEILRRSAAIPVVEAEDQMVVAVNQVHVIPPNRDMTLAQGALQLSVPDAPRGQRLPIDAFLRSLASDCGARAIGIILSGTGTDGTLGLRAIQEVGGLTLVQEPTTAKYDGMPQSAIEAGCAAFVLPVEEMPALLAGPRTALPPAPPQDPTPAPPPAPDLTPIITFLRTATGHDFSQYRKSTIGRRVERRMVQHEMVDTDSYLRLLEERPGEVRALFMELLINVTSFFRDPEAFDALKEEVLPLLLADKPADYTMRVWVAGCATGEEAYSIAILLREFMAERQREQKVQIYATDLDEDAIAIARAGVYPPNIVADVNPERLRRYFLKEDGSFRIKKEIRELVVFAVQNVIKDPPFTRLDLLACRNMLIYLEPDLQSRLIPAFHYALKPGGVLFLSSSESTGSHADLFSPVNRKWKLYQAIHTLSSARPMLSGGLAWAADRAGHAPEELVPKKAGETNFAELTARALLQAYAPASVVTDAKGNVLYIHGETGKYLRPAPGHASLSLIAMAREGLQVELRAALQAAVNQQTPTIGRDVVLGSGRDALRVALSVRVLSVPNAGQGMLLVSFEDLPGRSSETAPMGRRGSAAANARRVEELERALAYTHENLQAIIEEQQAANEELMSANEELQSANEELQSTNEELETSKEELQSLNEELTTVNAELQAKIEQLANMQNDMKNLLENINLGTIFLDDELVIRRFTREAARVFRLVATDVGRLLADIKSDLQADELLADARAVMASLVPREREVRTKDGASYLARIQPYRTMENFIDGVVLTFTDISAGVAIGREVQTARALAEDIVDAVREPLVVLNSELHVVTASRSFYQAFGTSAAAAAGRPIEALGGGPWDVAALRRRLKGEGAEDPTDGGAVVALALPDGGRRDARLNVRRVAGAPEDAPLILLTIGWEEV